MLITPNWPAPDNIHAFCSTRQGGLSQAPFDSLNLAKSVGDDIDTVEKNRQLFYQACQLPQTPIWLEQIHSALCIPAGQTGRADASYTQQAKQICIIQTADCLPILLCAKHGNEVAAIHAGWRGLKSNIILNTINTLKTAPEELYAWLGPAIGPKHFQVGHDVYEAFTNLDPKHADFFIQQDDAHWLADIYGMARWELNKYGVKDIYGGDYCTYQDAENFFSYRRDHTTGRMASLIYFT